MTLLILAALCIFMVWCAEGFRSGFLATQEEIETRGQDDPGWHGCVWGLAIVAAAGAVLLAAAAGALTGGAP